MLAQNIDEERLIKVLALTASDQDGEAVAAIRAANTLMSNSGLSLKDLVRRLPKVNVVNVPKQHDVDNLLNLEVLRRLLTLKSEEAVTYQSAIHDLQQQITVLEASWNQKNKESEGWKMRAWKLAWAQDKDLKISLGL